MFLNCEHHKPCVVYSHSHSGNRMEAMSLLSPLIEEFSVCSFDFGGFGHSEGKYSTLGAKEQDDLSAVVKHLREQLKMQTVYVWGRSMGAVTALMLAQSSPETFCEALVLDAPFASTQRMVVCANQLCNVVPNIPNLILYLLFSPLGEKLKEITGHDVIGIDVLAKAKDVMIPAAFFVTEGDTVSGRKDVTELFEAYGGSFCFIELLRKLFLLEKELIIATVLLMTSKSASFFSKKTIR